MISVKVHTILELKRIIGKREVDISVPGGCTMQGLIDEMIDISYQLLSNQVIDLLHRKRQVILYGPPGTGKTYQSKRIGLRLLQ